MINFINKDQYDLLIETKIWDGNEDFHELLEHYTGIEAKAYTGYSYYDSNGNYLGDSNDVSSIRDLLNRACIRIGE